MKRPTIKRLREVLAYDPETGRLTWKIRMSQTVMAGDEAGSKDKNGYVRVKVDGIRVLAHRAIFAMVKGRWPKVDVDHDDRNRSNNRWLNLREANETQNRANSKRPSTNSTGFKGVSFKKGAFEASIMFRGKGIYLGRYPTPEIAHAAYVAKAKELFGEFARAA